MKGEAAKRRPWDPTIYPEEERVGEDILQRWIIETLRPLLQRWLSNRRIQALVGADQFIYYRQHDSHARVAPDLYVLPGVSARRRVPIWKIWIDRVVPSFALEVVSQDWEKDYIEVIDRYRELGVKELVIFNPDCRQNKQRVRWQVFRRASPPEPWRRRVGKRGLVRVEVSNGARVRSKQLDCWFRVVGSNGDTRLRIATGARGEELLPTAEEDAATERLEKEHERAAKEAALAQVDVERAAKEHERQAKEQEQQAKEAALARIRELEIALRRRQR